MPGFLQRLRAKPEKTRKRIALGTSVTVTSLVFVMWVTVLNYGFIGGEGGMQDINTNTTQVASPLSAFSDNASTAFQQLQERLSASSTVDDISDQSTTSQDNPLTTTNRNDSYQSNSGSDMYWVNHRQMQSESTNTQTESSVTNSQSAAANNSTEEGVADEEPFTSRNYNPNQESEWFAQ